MEITSENIADFADKSSKILLTISLVYLALALIFQVPFDANYGEYKVIKPITKPLTLEFTKQVTQMPIKAAPIGRAKIVAWLNHENTTYKCVCGPAQFCTEEAYRINKGKTILLKEAEIAISNGTYGRIYPRGYKSCLIKRVVLN
jgi:hypothetical protein